MGPSLEEIKYTLGGKFLETIPLYQEKAKD
jgi:hypothetical protein